MKISSSLCQRCAVLQFNDDEHGRVAQGPWGKPVVIFDKCDRDPSKECILLDYYLFDNLPNLPVMSASTASGCGMCLAMREKIVQFERRADPKHKSVLIYKFSICYKSYPQRPSHEGFSTMSHLAVHFKFKGDRDDDKSTHAEAGFAFREHLYFILSLIKAGPSYASWQRSHTDYPETHIFLLA
ncbi:hypothetical protein RIB2604_00600810 [Aspergillus luchuensis]|uniref:Uncharacterized protein n=1 Tax=Aspergillus kawachii TaxID=1069201 RepID=A0A146F101_ASPKA|nr:hypothetical protein RIB2604_00600810 [Aspergillus luchuensis]